MNLLLVHFVISIVLLIILFFLSRHTTNQLFYFLRHFFTHDKTVFNIIAFIFFPGTVLHELAHFFAAIILFLRVRDLKVFPEWKDDYLKLGHVLYERKDFFRGFLVGIAPIFAGLLFFLLIFVWKLFPNQNLLINLLLIYLIFTVSSTMFSSKQDLKDLVYIPPLLVLLYGIIYVFDIKLELIFRNNALLQTLISFITQINFFLVLSLTIHVGTVVLIRILLRRK